jgi:hypothetical protein
VTGDPLTWEGPAQRKFTPRVPKVTRPPKYRTHETRRGDGSGAWNLPFETQPSQNRGCPSRATSSLEEAEDSQHEEF